MSRVRHRTKRKESASLKCGDRPFAMPWKGRHVLLACAVIAAVAVAAYGGSFTGKLFFDNKPIIVDNEMLKQDGMTGKIFSSNYWEPLESDLYRPLTIYTYYVNYKVWGWGDKPEGYHVCNLVLHVLNGLLVFFLLSKLTGRILIGAFSALLFVTHPIATEAVTNVVGRADLLAMFFVLGAFLTHITGSTTSASRRLWFYAGGALLLALGLLSKENAVVAVAVFLAFDVILLWPKIRGEGKNRAILPWLLRRLYTCHIFYIVIIGGWFLVRHLVLGPLPSVMCGFIESPLLYVSFFQRQATAVAMLGLYLFRLLWPVTLSADYSYNAISFVTSPTDARLLGSLAALLVVLAASVVLWKKSPVAAFFIWFFFIAIAPVSNVFVVIGTIGAERLLYMPSLAWSVCLALGVFWIGQRVLRKGSPAGEDSLKSYTGARTLIPAAVLLCLAGLYGYRTFERNKDWENKAAFWTATYKASPDSVKAIDGYAQALRENAPRKGIELLERGFGISDEYLQAYLAYSVLCMDVGTSLKENGDVTNARKIYLQAYERLEHYRNLDSEHLREMKRRLAEMGEDVGKLTVSGLDKIAFAQGSVCELLADTYPSGDKKAEYLRKATTHYREAVLKDPKDWNRHLRLGNVHLEMARTLPRGSTERQEMLDLAAVSFVRAIIVSDRADAAWRRLGTVYQVMGLSPFDYIDSPETSRDGRFYFKNDDKARDLNTEYLTLGARSQIMLELTRRKPLARENATHLARRAARRFRVSVPLERTLPLRARNFSRDDEHIWTGK